jgi:REP element-mobilizing transposase RayT
LTQFEFKQVYGRNLPHIQPPGATLFVTFRLAGTIPRSVLEEWLRDKRRLESERMRRESAGPAIDPDVATEERLAFQRRWFRRFETLLHAGRVGPVWLKEDRVAEIVREALHHRDGRVYRLDAFCIMPNHVHVVFAPLLTEATARKMVENARKERGGEQQTQTDSLRYRGERDGEARERQVDGARATQTDSLRYRLRDPDKGSVLAVIMQSLKGYTARKCNLVLGRSGQFWQHESFDHIIRDEPEFVRIIRYTLNNPVKEKMVDRWSDWKWNYCRQSLIQTGVISR